MSIDSIRFKSYNNVLDTLKCVGEQHLNIHSVTSGDIWEIDLEKNTLYPLFHINPVNVTVGQNIRSFNFQLFIMDLVEPDGSNEQAVYSDVLQICIDIIAILSNSKWQAQLQLDINAPVYFAEGNFTLEPFKERFDQSVTGWVFNIGVTVGNDFQSCEIPMTNKFIGK